VPRERISSFCQCYRKPGPDIRLHHSLRGCREVGRHHTDHCNSHTQWSSFWRGQYGHIRTSDFSPPGGFSSLTGPGSSAASASTTESYCKTNQAVVTLGGQVITAYEPDGARIAVVDGTTITVGGPPVTIRSQVVSLDPSGIVVFNNGQSQTVALSAAGLSASLPPATGARTTSSTPVP